MLIWLVGLVCAAPVTPELQEAVVEGTPIRFAHSRLVEVDKPTSLQFGPDGRLYVSQIDGTLLAYTIERRGPGRYDVVATERIDALKDILNHDDSGVARPDLKARLVTGILVEGTADSPVIYATSSDPRMGDKGGPDLGIDTDSGVVSVLTRADGVWTRRDLVTGLPQSREDHAPHGLQRMGDSLLVSQGGNTNMGAPSSSFSMLSETLWSAAILQIDLEVITGTFDLRSATSDGPVRVFAPGFRNAYDLLVASDGRIYVTDNGANRTWGGPPVGCSNQAVEQGVVALDALHRIERGSYGGHANPARSQCHWRSRAQTPSVLKRFGTSTNGLAEYTASSFGGAMRGDLLTVSFSGTLWRIPAASGPGQAIAGAPEEGLAGGFGVWPLDVTTQGDDDPFPGTIWVAVHLTERIQVFEPVEE